MRETALGTSRPEKKDHEEILQTGSRDSQAVHGADHGEAGCARAPHEDHGKVDLHTAVHGGLQAEADAWQEL